MAFSMAGGGPTAPQLNVTPLIDVLLVLLIIFMPTVMQEKLKGLEAQMPQPANPADQTFPAATVHDRDPGTTWQDRGWASPRQGERGNHALGKSRERLRDIFASRIARFAYVRTDDIDFQDVADVIAIARIAGVDRVGLMTEDGSTRQRQANPGTGS